MTHSEAQKISEAAINQALSLGADAAGIASWSDVAAGPSYQIQPMMKSYTGVSGVNDHKVIKGDGPQPVSMLVVGVAHPANQMKLDWWHSHLPRRTKGNDLLAEVTLGVAQWMQSEHGIQAWDMPYFPGRGGVFLKDAALMAGLGCVGRNNLFIAPKHGPRIRLRAMGMDLNLPSSGMIEFDPCVDCDEPCRKVCPQDALSEPWLADLKGPSHLPARDGSYDRTRCILQMEADIDEHRMISVPESDQPSKQVRYCRRCEIACVAERRRVSSS